MRSFVLCLPFLDPFCKLHSEKVCRIDCKSKWIQLNDYLCVQNFSQLTTFSAAKSKCRQIGGQVFHLNSWNQFDLLKKLKFSPNDHFWVEPSETGYVCGIADEFGFQLSLGQRCVDYKAKTLCQLPGKAHLICFI